MKPTLLRKAVIVAMFTCTMLYVLTFASTPITLTTVWKIALVVVVATLSAVLARSRTRDPLIRFPSPWLELASVGVGVNAAAWFVLSIATAGDAFSDRAIYAYLMAVCWVLLVGRARGTNEAIKS